MQLKYQSMSKDDMAAIAEAQTKGDMGILYKHPRLKGIAQQGVITIKVKSVDRLVSPALWRGTHKHVYASSHLTQLHVLLQMHLCPLCTAPVNDITSFTTSTARL